MRIEALRCQPPQSTENELGSTLRSPLHSPRPPIASRKGHQRPAATQQIRTLPNTGATTVVGLLSG